MGHDAASKVESVSWILMENTLLVKYLLNLSLLIDVFL